MAYSGLVEFITALERESELYRIKTFVDPLLEITEIADRCQKNNCKALLFENNGTSFPLLINAYGSDLRLKLALGKTDPDTIAQDIMTLFNNMTSIKHGLTAKFKALPGLLRLSTLLPKRSRRKGECQSVIINEPDLGILPVLKCWPFDGGRYITLPMVHTIHPDTGSANLGMYRMQVLDGKTTAMHWQLHKTGANHFAAWKKSGRRMPVTVTLGGDPVYSYCATAPLPENIDEYILAGFLRKKRVKLVKCITNDLYVPADCDFVIEGYVDPDEDMVIEGPFGDHTGFYSLTDLYPRFHVTCITHSHNPVYPATIVGIPPMEDAWLALATEKIFLAPVKLTLQPEILDFHMPVAGVAHNLAIVKISKTYPGQGRKVISSLSGAGQMMFTKYMIVVSGDLNLRNYDDLAQHILENTSFLRDLILSSGPLDVLDHSSDTFAFGGKAGLDASIKLPEESQVPGYLLNRISPLDPGGSARQVKNIILSAYSLLPELPIMVVSIAHNTDNDVIEALSTHIDTYDPGMAHRLILGLDPGVLISDLHDVAWQILGNSDPQRDLAFISNDRVIIDGTFKAGRKGGFPRRWPAIVSSSAETIERIDMLWSDLGIGNFIPSPGKKYLPLSRSQGPEL